MTTDNDYAIALRIIEEYEKSKPKIFGINPLKCYCREHINKPVNVEKLREALAFVKMYAITSKCRCEIAGVRTCLHCQAEDICQK
jgi:hypothetical protein